MLKLIENYPHLDLLYVIVVTGILVFLYVYFIGF